MLRLALGAVAAGDLIFRDGPGRSRDQRAHTGSKGEIGTSPCQSQRCFSIATVIMPGRGAVAAHFSDTGESSVVTAGNGRHRACAVDGAAFQQTALVIQRILELGAIWIGDSGLSTVAVRVGNGVGNGSISLRFAQQIAQRIEGAANPGCSLGGQHTPPPAVIRTNCGGNGCDALWQEGYTLVQLKFFRIGLSRYDGTIPLRHRYGKSQRVEIAARKRSICIVAPGAAALGVTRERCGEAERIALADAHTPRQTLEEMRSWSLSPS